MPHFSSELQNSPLPNTQTSKVVSHVVAVRHTSEVDTISWGRNVYWRRNVIGKSSMLVEVEDKQTISDYQYFST
jgi:hypothetical protein